MATIQRVKGNMLELAIPLQKETMTPSGKVTEDYFVPEGANVKVLLVKDSNHKEYSFDPSSVIGNVVTMTDDGRLTEGRYAVEVRVREADGTPLRSKYGDIVEIFDRNDDVTTEYNDFIQGSVQLNAQVFFFAKGDKGDQGIQGEKGDKGDKGDQGIQGEKGDKGDKGDQGIQGEKGDKGDKGDQGIQGEKGDKGDKGDQGIQGEKGDKGDKGDQGIQGEKGDKGEKGDQGIQGEKGDQGIQGERGPQGVQGEQGIQGPASPVNISLSGTSITFTNNQGVHSSLDVADALAPVIGDINDVLDDINGEVV